jgi:hypothetical protein
MRTMRKSGALIVATLVFVQVSLHAQSTPGALSEETSQVLLRSQTEEWVASLSQELVRLHAAEPPSPAVYDLVVRAVPVALLPEDPRAAARMLFSASIETDRALRRGIPRSLLRAEIRVAWQSAFDSGAPFAFRLQGRANKAAERFGAENRRAWDQSVHGKNDQGGGPGAAGGRGSP